jgi:ABC-type multidrug transport system fused ATPase/permease subunit
MAITKIRKSRPFTKYNLGVLLWSQSTSKAKILYFWALTARLLIIPAEFVQLLLLKDLIELAISSSKIPLDLASTAGMAARLITSSLILMALRIAAIVINRKFSVISGNTINSILFLRLWNSSLEYNSTVNLADISQKSVLLAEKIDKGLINPLSQIQICTFSSVGLLLALLKTVPLVVFLALLPVAVVAFLFLRYISDSLRKSSHKLNAQYSKLTELAQFMFLSQIEIFSSNSNARLMRRFSEEDIDLRQSLEKISMSNEFPKPIIEFTGIFSLLLILSVSFLVLDNKAQAIAGTAAFAIGLQRLLPQFVSITSYYSKMQGATSFLKEYYDLCINTNNNPEAEQAANHNSAKFTIRYDKQIGLHMEPKPQGEKKFEILIATDKLVFSENEHQSSITKIHSGDKLMVQGQSGVGKTTLFRDLCYFINNQYNHSDITEQLSCYFAPSRAYVMNDTVDHNISFFEDISADSQRRLIDSKSMTLVSLSNQLESNPTDNNFERDESLIGPHLSLGELQRISICRAIYSNRDILILDEPTANLNRELALTILQNVLELDKTVIVISHTRDKQIRDLFSRCICVQSSSIVA